MHLIFKNINHFLIFDKTSSMLARLSNLENSFSGISMFNDSEISSIIEYLSKESIPCFSKDFSKLDNLLAYSFVNKFLYLSKLFTSWHKIAYTSR